MTGFLKEGKHSYLPIQLGLLVSQNRCSLAYEVFAVFKYKGHTMLPDTFKLEKYYS